MKNEKIILRTICGAIQTHQIEYGRNDIKLTFVVFEFNKMITIERYFKYENEKTRNLRIFSEKVFIQ